MPAAVQIIEEIRDFVTITGTGRMHVIRRAAGCHSLCNVRASSVCEPFARSRAQFLSRTEASHDDRCYRRYRWWRTTRRR